MREEAFTVIAPMKGGGGLSPPPCPPSMEKESIVTL